MAEEIGIVMKLYDETSPVLRSIAEHTKAFDKSLDELREGLAEYDKAQETMTRRSTELKKALEASNVKVKDARTAYKKLKDETSKGALDEAIEEQTQLKRELAETENALKANSRAYEDLYSKARQAAKGVNQVSVETSKAENTAGGAEAGVLDKLWTAGLVDLVGDAASQFSGVLIESALGQPMATAVSSTLSGIARGAAIGSMLGPMGMAIGGLVGGASGAVSGWSTVQQAEDDSFKSYYGGLYETAAQGTEDRLAAGMTTAGQREQDQIAFAQRFGSEEAARAYLDQVRAMAVNTNYTYDEITGYSKSLLNSYSPEETLGVLQQLSDATAGLNLDAGGVSMFIAGLSRMRTTDKATQEYLNYFSERGLDVYEALSRSTGADKSQIAEMVTGGDISGTEAAQAILDYIQSEFGGLSERLASTYDAMVDNLGDAAAKIESAMGASYEEKAKEGLQADLDAYGGALGDALAEANRIIGEGRAIGENLDRQYSREALSALTMGTETTVYGEEQAAELKEMHSRYTALVGQYQNATEEDKAVIAGEIEALTEKAQAMAEGAYDASEMSQRLHDVNVDLIGAIRENTAALNGTPWMQSYETQQELSKGQGAAMVRQVIGGREDSGDYTDPDSVNYSPIAMGFSGLDPTERTVHSNAFGLERVPYDNYPALLHAGERVLTAREARNQDRDWGGLLRDWGTRAVPDAERQRETAPAVYVTVSNNSFGGNMTAEEVAEVIADRMMLKYQGGNRG